ncbi:small heat shock protein [Macrolepiota fuliginosa MF-IS2]|uniref:Small heat shock protein n=1 Tax=Macrolepiota fuliginosa MF-IS2 TaxID=1400762 RepID=A0A9P6C709_9AGAR|nr:small heat shock protein [Macrolepiota fuliginosa MF-IS2]
MSNNSVWFYESFYDTDRFFDEAFNILNQHFTNRGPVQRRVTNNGNGDIIGSLGLKPRMDLYEDTDKNVVTATFELPGLKKEDVEIELQNNRLTISGESTASEHDQGGYVVRERRFGKFSRTLQLPAGIKHEEIKATMENGVLAVTFPRSSPELAPKRIALL